MNETYAMKLAGIDLAWKSEKNYTAIAYGSLDCAATRLTLDHLDPSIDCVDSIIQKIKQHNVDGLAIDAPLIIQNDNGQRDCEKEIGREYGSRKAACHTTNKTLYPNAASVKLSKSLKNAKYSHLGKTRWQIECYPHPALIECFKLCERLQYKKGTVTEKKKGQGKLASLINSLKDSPILALHIPKEHKHHFCPEEIDNLKGQCLKTNEDTLDAIVCLYIAGLFALDAEGKLFGDVNTGYIWVPQIKCVKER